MAHYVNITLDMVSIGNHQFDLRVPTSMTLKDLIQTVSDSYHLDLKVSNPVARTLPTRYILFSTSRLEMIKNGMLLQVETI